MARTFDVSLEIEDAHVETVRELFGSVSEDLVRRLAQAALDEYVLAATGERVPAGVRDLRELRLRLLAGHLPDGMPTERQVADFFHLTGTQARNLIAGTRARYPKEFTQRMADTAKAALRKATKPDDNYRITASGSLAAYLRDILEESSVPPPMRRTDAGNLFDVTDDTMAELCRVLGLPEAEVGSDA
jgi:AcrR family transcriptional regulator